ncbi:hypothetical protein [Caulobacter sp. UC70_42]|uniref:hypothetical protein n=1 Tax=Caulobacter sp. UC70_42 TaxID=3374551 RepID=UPI0037576AD8
MQDAVVQQHDGPGSRAAGLVGQPAIRNLDESGLGASLDAEQQAAGGDRPDGR